MLGYKSQWFTIRSKKKSKYKNKKVQSDDNYAEWSVKLQLYSVFTILLDTKIVLLKHQGWKWKNSSEFVCDGLLYFCVSNLITLNI